MNVSSDNFTSFSRDLHGRESGSHMSRLFTCDKIWVLLCLIMIVFLIQVHFFFH